MPHQAFRPRISVIRRKELQRSRKEARYREAARLIDRGSTLPNALKQAGISRRTFAKLNERHQAIEAAPEAGRGRYRLTGKVARPITVVDASGRVRSVQIVGNDRVPAAVWQKEYGSGRRLTGATIRTVDGKRIRLSTDRDQIDQAVLEMTPEELEDLDIYRDDRYAAAA